MMFLIAYFITGRVYSVSNCRIVMRQENNATETLFHVCFVRTHLIHLISCPERLDQSFWVGVYFFQIYCKDWPINDDFKPVSSLFQSF